MAEEGEAGPLRELDAEVFCPVCSYSLHGAPGEKCPECGHSLANLRQPECRLPWTQRPSKDRYGSYWRTVWVVMFRPVRFWEEYAHALRVRDARLFQLVTVLHAYLPVLVATLILYTTKPFEAEFPTFRQMMTAGVMNPGPTIIEQAYAAIWPVVILNLGFVLFLVAATAVPICFFQPRALSAKRRDTAVAMSLYACAPLACYPLIVLAILCLAWLASLDEWGLGPLLAANHWSPYALSGAFGLCVFLWWTGLIRLVQRTMPQRKRRHAALGVSLPLIWSGLAVLLVGVLPLIFVYVLLMIVSLTG